MNSRVVTNSGPMMIFSKLNILHLLKQLYGEVVIPDSVYKECVINGIRNGFQDAYTLRLFLTEHQWKPVELMYIPDDISACYLDLGEKEAIALALSENMLLLMDEERGRDIARKKGIKICGSLGVLIRCYRKHLIHEDQLRFYFKQISERSDIWISSKLYMLLLEKELGRHHQVEEIIRQQTER